MHFDYRPLHPRFGVEIIGADLTRPVDDEAFAEIRSAFETHSLLLFRGPVLTDEQHFAFSQRFGRVQISFSANQSGGSYFSRQSNIDTATNAIMPADHRLMVYQKGNRLWHSDSSYRPSGSLCSILSAQEVPPEGGNTEFASLRVLWDDLPAEDKKKADGLVVGHSIAYSRGLSDPNALTPAQEAEMPPTRHLLVQTSPTNGRKSLFIGSHASHIEGWPAEEGRRYLAHLMERATPKAAIYSHAWETGDIVVWDNRCMLHRATSFDSARHRRLMQRTTVADGIAPLGA
jgi:alpha-ketoglutarate-dependent 2,4-dichlorophenoxyacetate dioxygenase